MSDIKQREEKMKEARRHTPRREFVMEICSWFPISFYKNNGLVSKYSDKNGIVNTVVSSKEFNELRDEFLKYGKDFGGNFFETVKSLLSEVPLEGMKQFEGTINTEYCDVALGKNIYLTSVGLFSEDIAYSFNVKVDCNSVFNSVMVRNGSNNIYSSSAVINSSNIFFSKEIQNCYGVWFSSSLIGCSECIFCYDLKNKSYCVNNVEYSKEEYQKLKEQILSKKTEYSDFYGKVLDLDGTIDNFRCENVSNSHKNYDLVDANNAILSGGGTISENIFDSLSVGSQSSRNVFALMGGGYDIENIFCSVEIALNA